MIFITNGGMIITMRMSLILQKLSSIPSVNLVANVMPLGEVADFGKIKLLINKKYDAKCERE